MIAKLQPIVTRMRAAPRLARYALTLLLIVMLTLLKIELLAGLETYPFVFSFAVVAVSAWALRTGIFATLAGGAIDTWIFMPPAFGFSREPLQLAALTSFLVAGLIASVVIEALHAANARLQLALAQARRLSAEREALASEMNHRMKNNFQLIASTLSLQVRRATDPTVQSVLQAAVQRISTMARVHSRLMMAPDSSIKVEARPFIESLCADLEFSLVGPRAVQIRTFSADAELKLSQATTLGLLINELVTNALKHAFPNERAGTVTVRFTCDGEQARLVVADNGVGFAEGDSGGIGNRLVEVLARQLEGQLSIAQQDGTVITIDFPLHGEAEAPDEPIPPPQPAAT